MYGITVMSAGQDLSHFQLTVIHLELKSGEKSDDKRKEV